MKQEVIKLESRYKDINSDLIQIEDNKYLLGNIIETSKYYTENYMKRLNIN